MCLEVLLPLKFIPRVKVLCEILMADQQGDVQMTTTAGTSSRRSSTGWISSSNSGEKFVPHYRRISTGSCHDFCKYGKNHTFETKSRRPMAMTRKSLDGGRSEDSVVLRERKKTGGGSVDGVVIPERKKTIMTERSKHMTRKSLDDGSSVDSMVLPERKKTTSPRMSKNVARKSLDGVVLLERKKTTSTRMSKNVARISLDGGSSVDGVVLLERKKTASPRMSKNVARSSIDGVVLLERKKTISTRMLKNVARISLDSGSSIRTILPERKKTASTRMKAELSSTSRMSGANVTTLTRPSPVQREVSNGRKKKLLSSPTQREVLNERKKKLLAEPKALAKSRSHTANTLNNSKPETSTATRNPEDSAVLAKTKERKLPEKSENFVKLRSIKVNPLRSAVSTDGSRRTNGSKMVKNLGTSKVAAKKVVATSTGSFSSNSIYGNANLTARKRVNLKGSPHKTHNKNKLSDHQQVQGEEVRGETFQSEEVQGETFRSVEVQEKTLYVIKVENEEMPHEPDGQNETFDNVEPLPSSPPNSLSPPSAQYILAKVKDQDVSEYTESETENDSFSESNEYGSMETDNVSSEEGGQNARYQNPRMLHNKEEDPQSTKLSFRRGKIIDIPSKSNSPRRLKFRRGRLLGESQRDAEGLRKNFKMGTEVDGDTATAQEIVVLRHQDVQQRRKDAQGLFNNVIEETASKLVETRKSKVKALVGAFETVISLQDGRLSPEY
ncbi:uncharacterized protein LOC111801497 isoform X1 [Cucurbita pepo subsp. pepo]|uniref:uncharacterized protein LOC111801497 isoform X1 n=2 Tax=Cucurbita pepo subsp. pepo TaxID=3664 RepID=UPI000C9D5F01|nr:uncharacterized protein LOC111801497 isoform X1 [Cucurbita pepo subsp. pepo]